MASRAKAIATTDHKEIRQWAEARGARPACVRGTGSDGDVGMIRLDFPGFSGEESLEEISWDDWFRSFDENGLALLHQETTAGGQKSNFNKLVARETAEGRQRSRRGARGSGTRSASTRGRSARASRSTRTRERTGRKRSRRSAKAGSRRAAASRASGSKARSSTRRRATTTRGRRRSTTARGTAKSTAPSRSARSSSRSARGSRKTSRQTNARGSRTRRGKVIAMKKTTRNRRRAA